jgi:superoxide reductase
MNRRNFLKGALLTTTVLASGQVYAEKYGQMKRREGLNRLMNKGNPSAMEQSHVPGIEAPDTVKPGTWFDVKIRVGFMKEHPSTSGHWITMIKLTADGKTVGNTMFKTGGVSAPVVVYRIKLDKTATLNAIENCNLHGTWESGPVTIKVA